MDCMKKKMEKIEFKKFHVARCMIIFLISIIWTADIQMNEDVIIAIMIAI